jgi:preprotein translocase subunit SecA
VSLEDDLMRIFASETITKIMDKLGWEEGEPIEHKMISRSIENAQKKVEGRNFDIRKHLLDYDDVLNKQREVIYKKRREFLAGGENLKDNLYEMADEVITDLVVETVPEKGNVEETDLNDLKEAVHASFNIHIDLVELTGGGTKRDDVTEYIRNKVHEFYDGKESEITPETMRQIERYIMLQTLDFLWKDHLLNMDHLREGIGLRGYAQRDPLHEYKREGFDMFSSLINRLSYDVCEKLFRVQPVSETDMERLEKRRRAEQQRMTLSRGEEEDSKKPVKRHDKKVGRNDPCPCGSGKKYKRCCGAS